ncbi:hypothetical protein P7C73_g5386, partial [Tremellales sp. Uapishka_1]
MNSTHIAAAAVELPIALQELRNSISNSRTSERDIEFTASVRAGERDPLRLRAKVVSDDTIKSVKHGRKGRKIAQYYEEQNDHINDLLKPLAAHHQDAAQEAEDNAWRVKVAVNLSFAANICLAILQLYAAISSLSLALFASALDAANLLDLALVGNIVYGSAMGGVNVILIVESIQEFITHSGSDTKTFHLIPIIVVGVAFCTKLALFLYCFAIRKSSSQVQVLWEDHRNDLLTNGFGILTSAGGAKLAWWIDPMGATIIAVCIITIWTITVREQFTFLAGVAAPPEYHSLVIYKAMTFHSEILQVDTCRVYHSGPQYFVELDIVLRPELSLRETHDIVQDLQDQIEALPDVDRCFVHADYEVDHKPEHRKTK